MRIETTTTFLEHEQTYVYIYIYMSLVENQEIKYTFAGVKTVSNH